MSGTHFQYTSNIPILGHGEHSDPQLEQKGHGELLISQEAQLEMSPHDRVRSPSPPQDSTFSGKARARKGKTIVHPWLCRHSSLLCLASISNYTPFRVESVPAHDAILLRNSPSGLSLKLVPGFPFDISWTPHLFEKTRRVEHRDFILEHAANCVIDSRTSHLPLVELSAGSETQGYLSTRCVMSLDPLASHSLLC